MRVLCVEDEALISLLACEMISELGHTVYDVADAEEAMTALAEGEPFDLMIVDIQLPGISGIELVQEARTLRPNLAVVFTTGFSPGDPRSEKAARLGPVIGKPYTLDNLRSALETAQSLR